MSLPQPNNHRHPSELSAAAAELYGDLPSAVGRFMVKNRPFICPFHVLMDHVPQGANVLDVGCGNGLFLGLLARNKQVSSGLGFDSSVAAIEHANHMSERLAGADPASRLTFSQIDVEHPWPDGQFEVVSMIDVLHHVPPAAHEEVIRMAARKVAPGGRLIYKDMARRPRWKAALNRLHDLISARQWIRYAPIETVERWVTEEGLTVTLRQDQNMLWYRHELRVFTRPA